MTYFQPELRVGSSPDGKENILSIDVEVPSGHYSIGDASDSAPSGIVLLPEAQPVQIIVRKRGGIGTPALQTLRVSRRYAKSAGKSSFAVFVMLDDLTDNSPSLRLVGRGGAPIPKGGAERAKTTPSGATVTGVAAWIEKTMPVSDFGSIHAVVTVSAPTGGYKYQLKEFEPLDFTGRAFGLELVATPPQAGITIPTETTLTFQRDLKKGEQFDQLFLQFEVDTIVAPIDIVS